MDQHRRHRPPLPAPLLHGPRSDSVLGVKGAGSLLLDLDPNLADGLDETEMGLARDACAGSVVRLEPGAWPSRRPDGRAAIVGCLIVDGLVAREVSLCDRHMLELMGPRDVVQLPEAAEWPSLGSGTMLTTITPSVVALLGARFVRAAARWPVLLTTVQRRIEEQRERLAVQGLIAHIPRAEDRLLLQLWHVASKWGRVTPGGTVLQLRLTHDLLAQLVGARRPTVTLAAGILQEAGYVQRLDGGGWLLAPRCEPRVRTIAAAGRSARTLGGTLVLSRRGAEVIRESRAVKAGARQTPAATQAAGPVVRRQATRPARS